MQSECPFTCRTYTAKSGKDSHEEYEKYSFHIYLETRFMFHSFPLSHVEFLIIT